MKEQEFKELLNQLSPDEQKEVMDFVKFLLTKKQAGKEQDRLQLSWAGGLKAYRNKYTALKLQKKSMEWMGG